MAQQSKNWQKNKDLPFISEGHHKGWPFSEGFPIPYSGKFVIVTAWGELVRDVTVTAPHPQRDQEWDASRSKLRKDSRVGLSGRKLLTEYNVAGWRQLT